MHGPLRKTCSIFILVALLFACWATPATAQYLRIRDICRVKGQEQNTLHGVGLVVGLEGTGDGDRPTTRALAKFLELLGNPISIDSQRQPVLTELENAKNVALVTVTATVPAEGARQGELLNVLVNAFSAKSLEGGHLMVTPLTGPRPGDDNVFGFAQGPLSKDKNGPATAGQVHDGCRLGRDIANNFISDGKITLVLDKHHASFQTANEIEKMLNNPEVSGFGLGRSKDRSKLADSFAKAKDQVNIEVRIPAVYQDDPVAFASEVLDLQIIPPRHDARVVIDKRNGVIIVGNNVGVGRVAVSHKNIAIQTGAAPGDGPLFVVDQENDTNTTRLQALVNALNGLKVSTEDIIDIVEALEASGDLYGKLIVK